VGYPVLAYRAGGGVSVDLDRLVSSRLLVQANSGGGKSRALRQLLEETHGRIQHIVFDPEGEFSTLREHFDYVVAGKEGDVHASPKTAKLLCRRLMEVQASAILDLYDLSLHERREFVKLFLTELMALPRALWRPCLVVIDEAHVFAPQVGESQALEAVITLCTQGRKRGFSALLATQRISKLHKDAAAELLNKLVGRTGLDVDVKRAGDELGMTKEARLDLRSLEPGEFFVYGPAISNEIQRVRTGPVKSRHPEPGSLGAIAPPPSEKVKQLLAAELADLPQQAEAEARTIADLEKQLRETKSLLKKAQSGVGLVDHATMVSQINAAVGAARKECNAEWERETSAWVRNQLAGMRSVRRRFDEAAMKLRSIVDTLENDVAKFDQRILEAEQWSARSGDTKAVSGTHVSRTTNSRDSHADVKVGNREQDNGRQSFPSVGRAQKFPEHEGRTATHSSSSPLPKGERLVLIAIAQQSDGATREQITQITGYKRSTRDAYIQRLQGSGCVEVNGGLVRATDAGIKALGSDYEPLPEGDALREYWLGRLPEGERRILEQLGRDPVSRDDLSAATGYKTSTRNAYIQRLMARRLVEDAGRSHVRASDILFD
jgi:hypothetical protein